jgi:hypothetical protein
VLNVIAARIILALLFALVINVAALPGLPLFLPPQSAFAASQSQVDVPESVSLAAGQNELSIPLTIGHPSAFAAVEMAVQCAEGVKVLAVDYSLSASKAGPVEARGLTWFSLFSGNNDFAGDIIATVHLSYSGARNTAVVIDHAAFHSRDGSAFVTENLALRQTVAINRQGADNNPPALEPPDPAAPGAGNPESGALVTYDPPGATSGAVQAVQATQTPSGDSLDAVSTDSDNAAADDAAIDSAAAASEAATTTIPSAEVPLANSGSTNNIPADGAEMDGLLLLITILSLASTAVLGLFFIAEKRRKKRPTRPSENSTRTLTVSS